MVLKRDFLNSRLGAYVFWFFWHTSAILLVAWAPAYVAFEKYFWETPDSHGTVAQWLILTYVGGAIAISIVRAFFSRYADRVLITFSFVSAILACLFLLILMQPNLAFSRILLLVGSVVVGALLFLPAVVPIKTKYLFVVPALIAVAGFFVTSAFPVSERSGGANQALDRYINTSTQTLRVTSYADRLPEGRERGGAIGASGNSVILMRSQGDFFGLQWDEGGRLQVTNLGFSAPMNLSDFDEDVPADVIRDWFRATDLLVDERGEKTVLFASHHVWNRSDACYTLRLSRLDISTREGLQFETFERGEWATVYEASPCLALKPTGISQRFHGLESGGRLDFLGDDQILMTVGDHAFDGVFSVSPLAQDPASHYGKTVLIDLKTGNSELFTSGHRNPQGLLVIDENLIWSTEHGPRGGDELNILQKGGNYGWPFETYGTQYGSITWPLQDKGPENTDYIDPVYSWVPSIGISNLLRVEGQAFPRWQDDLLIGSMWARQLWRMHMVDGQVAFGEPIQIGQKVRDLVQLADGTIVIWADGQIIMRILPMDSEDRGAMVFFEQCAGCHSVTGEIGVYTGPELSNIVGREIASQSGYKYSAALSEIGGNWTEQRLKDFLESPSTYAPGNIMAFSGIEDSDDRDAVVTYLLSRTRN